jgi:hypothetical protein
MVHENITALKRVGPYGIEYTAGITNLTWSEYDFFPVFCFKCPYLFHAVSVFQVYTYLKTTTIDSLFSKAQALKKVPAFLERYSIFFIFYPGAVL